MSSTTIQRVFLNDRIEDGPVLRNAWGSAPIVWSHMGVKYLGIGQFAYLDHCPAIWALFNRTDIPAHHRAVLAMTFDYAYVAAKDYAKAARDIRAFMDDFPTDQIANHWPTIACYLDTDDTPAFGLHCTSVSENPWDGEWDDQAEDYKPFDWSKAWNIYDELEAPSTRTEG